MKLVALVPLRSQIALGAINNLADVPNLIPSTHATTTNSHQPPPTKKT